MKPHPSRTTDLQSNYDHLLGKRPTTGYSKNYADHASILRRFGALFLDGLVLVCFDVLIELLGLRTIE